MYTIGKARLQSDENGLVTLQCDRCKSRFKIECSYLNDETEIDIYCPICGISNKTNTFLPEEVAEEAAKLAMAEAEEIIQSAFKNLNSKYLKVKATPVAHHDHELVFKNKDYDMEAVTVNCCEKKVSLKPADITAGFYCPYCGRIVK